MKRLTSLILVVLLAALAALLTTPDLSARKLPPPVGTRFIGGSGSPVPPTGAGGLTPPDTHPQG